jgi:membrane protein DedA with SNARE-associated domain
VEDLIVDIVSRMGALGVAFLMFAENVFPPIPSELIMPLAGYLASQGEMNYWGAIIGGTIGSLAGGALWYYIGYAISKERLMRWSERFGAWIAVTPDDVERTCAWFERHGEVSVFLGRLVPLVRTLISLPAGLTRMPFRRFLLFSAVGTFIWTFALTFAGRFLGSRFEEVESYVGPFSWLVIGVILAIYVYRLITLGLRRRAAKAR